MASRLKRDLVGLALIAVFGVAGYFAFPDNLALLTRIISLALLALSLDLVTGYCGVASLGQGALYGAGAYAAGIACVQGLTTDPVLLILIGALAGSLMGVCMGAIMLRAHGLPQLVLSIAIVQLLHEAANKASWLTGGSDGLAGLMPAPLFGLYEFDLWGKAAYLFGLALLVIIFALLLFVVRSPFGVMCQGAKADPVRVAAMGVRVTPLLLKMFAISGAVAGVGGALGAVATQVVGLDSVSFEISANALVMMVLGGVGTLFGPLIGAVVFMMLEHWIAAINPFHWMTMVGAVLIAVVFAAPAGLSGALDGLARRLAGGRR